MKFKGEIHQFSVLDLLQYLHEHEETGVLELTSPQGEKSELYFSQGQCVRAKHPEMRNLGDILKSKGKINQAQIDIALTQQQKQGNQKAFGAILREHGFVGENDVRLAMTQQIEEVVHRLMKLNSGLFKFAHKDAPLFDDIKLKFHDLVLPEEMNTAYLLLDAISRFDPESNPGEGADESEDSEFIPETTAEQVTFAISLLKLMMTDARKLEQGQGVLTLFLNILSEYVERAVLFSVHEDCLVGIGGFGKKTDGQALGTEVRKLKIPVPENPTLIALKETRDNYCEAIPDEPWSHALHQTIGRPTMDRVLLLPIGGVEAVTSVVYADMGGEEKAFSDLELLDLAAAQTGVLMENVYLRTQLKNFYKRSLH